MTKTTERLLTTREAAELLGVTGGRVRQLALAGLLPQVEWGGHSHLFRYTEVEKFRTRRAKKSGGKSRNGA